MKIKSILAIAIAAAISATTAIPASAASSTFYLSLKNNTCYSFTKSGNQPVTVENDLKKMYAVSCSKGHHFQVIKTGQAPSAGAELTQEDMQNYCLPAYTAKYGAYPKMVSGSPLVLRWYFPDPGAETLKYGNKAICIVHIGDDPYTSYMVMKKKY